MGAGSDAQLDRWRQKYPKVAPITNTCPAAPTRSSRNAPGRPPMVVGPRTHGYQGLMLGSIGSRLLQRSGRPELIAR
ncbi:hypothetical protein Aab01nite_01430 [Paractinoplanes abujensis]|nr:hypothetical protein Aab01nite_01430 [Actinoplanes abujensis]